MATLATSPSLAKISLSFVASLLRCFFAGGLRIYYTIRDGIVVILLAGGDKSTQARDIEKAAEILHGGFTDDHQDQTI